MSTNAGFFNRPSAGSALRDRPRLVRTLARMVRRPAVCGRADALYARVVARARAVPLYAELGVPDTVEGRFAMIVLHLALVVRRLRGHGIEERALAQALFDAMLDDMDRNLREMGVGDLAVGKRVKAMARAFYGRAVAYDEALAADGDDRLAAALARNVFANDDSTAARPLAAYVRRLAAALAAEPTDALLAEATS